MAADIAAKVRNFTKCKKNRVRFCNRKKKLKLFTEYKPFDSAGIDILGLLTKSSKGRRFLLVITERFLKLTKVIPLRRIDALTVEE